MLKLCAVLCLFLAACGGGEEPDKINVFVAASLIDVVGESSWEFEQESGVHVNHSPGSSSTLARQIIDGAPAHVYFSASWQWVDELKKRNMLKGEAQVFARNELVCIFPKGAPGFADFGDLKDRRIRRVAIADDGVPAGDYARQAMDNAGVKADLQSKLVGQHDVRAVLNAVQSGEVDAGFVYLTDALFYKDGVEVGFKVDESLHDPVECYIAKVKGAPAYVDRYVDYMLGADVRARLKKLGFKSAD